MTDTVKMGMNKTGVGTSPFDVAAMLSADGGPGGVIAALAQGASPEAGAAAVASYRAGFIDEALPLGSVPPPTTLKGLAKTAIQKLKGDEPEVFIDKLGERLAYERTGTRLYDLLLGKGRARRGEAPGLPLDVLQSIRDAEARHFDLLVRTCRRLGADPTVMTPSADVAGVMALGLVQVVADPRTTVAHALQAALLAEAGDVEGWTLLIALAEEIGLDEDAAAFRLALVAEEQHERDVRTMLTDLMVRSPAVH